MRIGVLTETDSGEPRVAAVPDMVKKYVALGAEVAVQSGAGRNAGITDKEFEDAGASVLGSADDVVKDADVVIKVRRPNGDELKTLKKGTIVIAIMDPYGREAEIKAMADAGIDAFAMELMPRITRAQVMDVLSSQANLAGYRAVVDAASEFGKALPMMMTAAGTVPAAKAFVMGVGVAGLQAIATAKRLGAVVSATDVRPAVKEQVASLGGKFVAVEDDEFKQAETSGGYAKEMSAEYQKKQAELVASHIAKQDIVVTTALIPGRPAPKLVSKAMVDSMKPGSIIVDLAVERGGNVEGSKLGEVVVTEKGVKIVGHANVPGRLAATASGLYAKNLYAFVETMVDKEKKVLAVKWDDELVKATNLTRDGQVVHETFKSGGSQAAKAEQPKSDTPKPDDVKSQEAAADTTKAETPKPNEAPPEKHEVAKADAPKPEPPKTEPPKTEPPKSDDRKFDYKAAAATKPDSEEKKDG